MKNTRNLFLNSSWLVFSSYQVISNIMMHKLKPSRFSYSYPFPFSQEPLVTLFSKDNKQENIPGISLKYLASRKYLNAFTSHPNQKKKNPG